MAKGRIIIERKKIRRVFDQYVSTYNVDDPKIKLKIEHTYRVADLAERIATKAGIGKDLAWLCGMLHDIGRFEQVRRYNTFADAISVDHAEFGADLLFRENLINKFELSLSQKELLILEHSIRYHSLYRLPEKLTEQEIRYCNVLRDADKVDIFHVNCDTPFEDIYNVTTKDLRQSGISEEVKQCFLNHTAVLKKLKITPADYVVSLVCLAFELVYPISRQIAKEQGYVDKILAFESDNEDTVRWFQFMKEDNWYLSL